MWIKRLVPRNAASGAGEGGSGGAASTGDKGGAATTGGGNAQGGAASGGNGAGQETWYGKFPEDIRGYVEAKGFKGPEDVVNSYRNAEKLLGVPKDKLLKLPDEKADPKEWNEIYAKLGRPESVDGYQIDIPEKGGNKEFGEWAKKTFHELGLTKKQGESLAKLWNEKAAAAISAEEQASNDASHEQFANLKKEWGAGFDAKVRAKNELVKLLGIDDATHANLEKSLGVDGAAKLFDSMITKFGIKLGEHQFHGGGGGNNFGNMTPEGAAARKDLLLADSAYRDRYLNGGAAETAEIAKLEEAIWHGKNPG